VLKENCCDLHVLTKLRSMWLQRNTLYYLRTMVRGGATVRTVL
jgi:hypothetical protein